MLIVALECIDGHQFEGWYDSREDYYFRLENSQMSCPICNSGEIHRRNTHTHAMSVVGKSVSIASAPVSDHVRLAVTRALEKIRRNSFLGDEEGVPFFQIQRKDIS